MTGYAWAGILLLQGAIGLAVIEGVRRRNVPAVINSLGALVATFVPAIVQSILRSSIDSNVSFGPELPLWIAVAGLIHAVGMLGLYDGIWWWDHLAHTVSAALVTALVYAGVLVVSRDGSAGVLSIAGVVGITLGFVLLVALFWELIEQLARHVAERYDIGPVLVVYGPYDTALDLVFNLVGAGLVILLDLRVFVSVFEPYPPQTAQLLLAIGGAMLVGSGLLGLFLGAARAGWP